MQDKIQERMVLLLFVLFSLALCLEGCGRRGGEVYMAGLESEAGSSRYNEAGNGTGNSQAAGYDPETEYPAAAEAENTSGEAGDAAGETEGYIYVCGAVCRPGVYPMHSGMRVFEAVELAGGFAEDADEEWLNQAGQLQDGQQLYIYTDDETQRMKEEAGSAGTIAQQGLVRESAAAGKVNLNTADAEILMTLPGIGEVKAEAIIQYRTEHGSFSSIEEIQNIPGIKQAVFSKIEDQITV